MKLVEHDTTEQPTPELLEQNHAYYQGLLVVIGNLKGLDTFVPNQDKNKRFVNTPLRDLQSLQTLPAFSHPQIVKRSSTVDVMWLNSRQMPHSLFEVEHSTDVQNSLLKFYDLQDFSARMVIVADTRRRPEFEAKRHRGALDAIRDRVKFLDYDMLVKEYEHAVMQSERGFAI